MEQERYQELEDRRRMLQLLHDKLQAARDEGESCLELYVIEGPGETGFGEHGAGNHNAIGEALDISGARAVALFKRLRDRYLKGRGLHNPNPMVPLFVVQLEDLTDDGWRMIELLPQEQLISAFRNAITAAEDPETPGTPEEKRAVIEWLNGGIGLVRNVAWLADKLNDVM